MRCMDGNETTALGGKLIHSSSPYGGTGSRAPLAAEAAVDADLVRVVYRG